MEWLFGLTYLDSFTAGAIVGIVAVKLCSFLDRSNVNEKVANTVRRVAGENGSAPIDRRPDAPPPQSIRCGQWKSPEEWLAANQGVVDAACRTNRRVPHTDAR